MRCRQCDGNMQAVSANVDFTKPPNLEALPFHDEEVRGPRTHVAVSQKWCHSQVSAKHSEGDLMFVVFTATTAAYWTTPHTTTRGCVWRWGRSCVPAMRACITLVEQLRAPYTCLNSISWQSIALDSHYSLVYNEIYETYFGSVSCRY